MKEGKLEGATFDNSHKETEDALSWFRNNLYLKDGLLYWGDSVGTTRRRAGNFLNKPAGCVSSRGYIQIRMGLDKFMAHRIIWALHYGSWPKVGIDHINGDRLDNRIENMREVTQFSNSKNAAKYPRKENWVATGGGRLAGGKWYAGAQVDKTKIHIGSFNCHTAAMIARKLFDIGKGFSDRHGAELRVY